MFDEKGPKGHEAYQSLPAFQIKMLVYKYMAVLIALENEENATPKCTKVRVIFEHSSHERFSKAQEVFKVRLSFKGDTLDYNVDLQRAKAALSDLLFDKKEGQVKGPSWAMRWFNEIKIDETNPVTLTLFAVWFMDFYITIIKTIRQFDVQDANNNEPRPGQIYSLKQGLTRGALHGVIIVASLFNPWSWWIKGLLLLVGFFIYAAVASLPSNKYRL